MNEPDADNAAAQPIDAEAALRRAAAAPDRLVKIARYATPAPAEINALALEAEGIHAEVFGANTAILDWFWQNFNDVDLYVPERDVARAAAIIARTHNDLEPAEEPASATPPADERGRPLVPAAVFDNVAGLRNAEAMLGSNRIHAFPPRLVPRGERPPGRGKRFVLRVADEDLQRARAVLREEVAADREEPRCPACGSWNVYKFPRFWRDVAAMVGLGAAPEHRFECLACHHGGTEAEFMGHVTPQETRNDITSEKAPRPG